MQNTDTLKDFLKVAGAKFFAIGSLFICGVFVARAVGPEGFGYYSTALTLIIIFEAIIGSPLDYAVVRFNSFCRQAPDRVERVQGAVFRFKCLVGFVITGLALLNIDWLTTVIFGTPDVSLLLIISLVSGVILLITRSTASFLQIHLKFDHYSYLDTLQGILRFVFVCILFFCSVKSASLYLGVYGLSALLAFMIFFIVVPQKFIFASAPDKADRRKLISYIGATSFIVVLGTITGRADIPLLSMLSDGAETGHYSAAMQIATIGTLLASYATVVFQPRVVEMAATGELQKLLRWNFLLGFCLALLCIPIAISVMPWFLPLLFGDVYLSSVPVLQILLIGICADFVILPLLMPYALQVIAKQVLIGEAFITLLFFALVLFIPIMDAVTMAWVVTIVRLLKLVLYFGLVSIHLTSIRRSAELTTADVKS